MFEEEFIHIKTTEFLVLPNETEEFVNEGMYGKALSGYLSEELKTLQTEVKEIVQAAPNTETVSISDNMSI